MRSRRLLSIFCLLLVVPKYVYGADTILKNIVVYDGTTKKPFKADVRSKGDRIAAIAKTLVPQPGEIVRDEHGLALAPGFIDMHSDHDRGIFDDLDAEAVTRQCIPRVFEKYSFLIRSCGIL